jgi:hypothetical protein
MNPFCWPDRFRFQSRRRRNGGWPRASAWGNGQAIACQPRRGGANGEFVVKITFMRLPCALLRKAVANLRLELQLKCSRDFALPRIEALKSIINAIENEADGLLF